MTIIRDQRTRLDGDKAVIDPVRVRQFFSARARHADTAHPLATAMNHDDEPEFAGARDQYERQFAMLLLALNDSVDVLDVGCGIGRWVSGLAARTHEYVGIDYTGRLLDAARAAHPSTTFHQLDAVDLSLEALNRDEGFGRVIASGLLCYLNDGAAQRVLRRIGDVSALRARIYLRTPLAIGDRLTLRGHWSPDLQEEYHAIHRTGHQMDELFARTLGRAGFRLLESGDLYPPSLNAWADTRQHYWLWERS